MGSFPKTTQAPWLCARGHCGGTDVSMVANFFPDAHGSFDFRKREAEPGNGQSVVR